MRGRSFGRAIGFDVARQMKAMYDETTRAGGKVWTMQQIAERFQVSESSTRRAILGIGSYRLAGEPAPFKTDEELKEDAQRFYERMQKEMAAQPPDADKLLERMDAPTPKLIDTEVLKERLRAQGKWPPAGKGG